MKPKSFKKWDDLTNEQQQLAVGLVSCAVIEKMMAGGVECPDHLRQELNKALQDYQLMILPLYKAAEMIMMDVLDDTSVLKNSVLSYAIEATKTAEYYFGNTTIIDLFGGNVIVGEKRE